MITKLMAQSKRLCTKEGNPITCCSLTQMSRRVGPSLKPEEPILVRVRPLRK